MGRYTLARDIAAPADEVFKAFTDPRLNVDWLHAAAIRDATGPLDVVGTEYTLVIAGPHSFRARVVRSEPGKVHEVVMRGRFGSAHMVAVLEDRLGGTHLELLTEYSLPLGPIGRWLDRRFIDREPRTTANREIDRLVELVQPAA
jgi:uncharacterized protein YndB with AHSA1/START domain